MKRRIFLFVITLLIALSNMNCAKPIFVKQAEFDGLIIDATEQDFRPVWAPRIFSSSGCLVYHSSKVKPEVAIEQGMTGFSLSINKAKEEKGKRGIKNPLIVKAVGMLSKEELIVSDEDAKKIIAADKNTDFLANAKVIIVIKPKPADAAKPKMEPKKLRVKGIAPPPLKDAPVEIRAQEQFVVAVLEGIRGTAELFAWAKKTNKVEEDTTSGNIFTSFHERIGDFEVDSKTRLKDSMLEEDLINVNYKGQKFVIKNFQLISPPIESIDFPKWDNPPKIFGGIEIESVTWLSDGTLEVWLNYDISPLYQ